MSEDTEHETEATRREGPTRDKKPDDRYLERGALVGRYVILDRLGEGGMGVVYVAFDPELDRKVAIKLLQGKTTSGSSGGDQAWLLREAQAMARLQHANVVAVHDVGTLTGDRVWIAMELVDGETLRAWLKLARSWREIVPTMLASGTGLAAAHAAGLVHRDFKPENVLVRRDGRVYVMDFGLARLRTDEPAPASRDSDLEISAKSPLSANVTIAGTVVGTPAYMAPEIYEGHGADARTDQFAFGVALYEALYRTRPFDRRKGPRDQLPKAPPADAKVPARIRRIVMRAISLKRDDRYPSMDALLAELAVDPAAPRRNVLAASALGIALAATVGGAYMVSRSHSELCTGAGRRLAGVWDAQTKQAIRTAFEATHTSFAKGSYAGLERALDRYAAELTATTVGSCEATRIRGDQTEDTWTLRQDCLDQRLEELRALTKLLSSADVGVVEKGDKVVADLEPIARCSNVTVLRAADRPPPAIAPKIDAVRKQLARARAELITGGYLAGLTGTRQALEAARQIGYEPLICDASLTNAAGFLAVSNLEEAANAFEAAAWSGVRSNRDDVIAQAALTMALIATQQGHDATEAKIWLGLGSAAASRVGLSDQALEMHRLEVEGFVDVQRGDVSAAVVAHEKALVIAQALYGVDGPGIWLEEAMVAATLAKSGAYAKATPHLEHALALREAIVGTESPDVAFMLSNLGTSYTHAHQDDKARKAFERALAIREKQYGQNSPMLVPTLNNLADHLKAHDLAAAAKIIERAKQIAEHIPGPMAQTVETTRAEILTAGGNYAEARKAFDDLLAIETKTKSPVTTTTLSSRGDLALAEHDFAGAATQFERAIALLEDAGGKDNPELWRPLTGLAQAKLGLQDTATPRALLERAIAIADKAQIDAFDIAPARQLLASLPK